MSASFPRQAPPPEGYVRFDPSEIETTIAQRFEAQAALYADQIAFDDDLSRTMTYAELNTSANRVAAHVLDRDGEQPGKAVALLFGYSAEALIAAIGLLKAGRMIVALDPTYPEVRNRYMLEDSEAEILITDGGHLPTTDVYRSSALQILTIEEIVGGSADDENPAISFEPDTYSHLTYTSGSTGRPKGVVHTHRNLMHLHCYANHGYRFSRSDRNVLLSSMSYGNSLLQIYNSLLNGGTVIPYDLRTRPIGDLPDWLRAQRASYISFVPSTFRQLFHFLSEADAFPDLRILALGGEGYRPDDIRAYRRWFSGSLLSLSYGTSETLWVTQCFADADSDIDLQAIPCGYEFGEHRVMLVDDEGQEVGDGEIGAATIRSSYLTPGYWRRPDLNEATFHADIEQASWRMYHTGDLAERREDGLFIHRGRTDYQIKVRGFRIEAGEVEAALVAQNEIEAAVVTVTKGMPGGEHLVAYVVTQSDEAPTPGVLRKRLAETLPSHMVPTYVIVMDALPRTISGKIDRSALPPPTPVRPPLPTAYRSPSTPLEAEILSIWIEAFGIADIGVDDNFLDLGGHSLLATQILSEVRRRLASQIAMVKMFETETVAELAALIEAEVRGDEGGESPGRIESVDRQIYKKELHESGTIHDDDVE